jgi:hypothetical protein
MLAAVRLADRLLALFDKFLTLLNSLFFSNFIAFVYYFIALFGIGRKSCKIILNYRVGQYKFRFLQCFRREVLRCMQKF